MLEYQVVQIMSATTPFFTLSLLFRICLLLLETKSRSDYVCCHPKPTIGQIMSATTLNLYYVQIMSATEPPPPFFRLIWLVQIMSATPPPCFYVFIHLPLFGNQ